MSENLHAILRRYETPALPRALFELAVSLVGFAACLALMAAARRVSPFLMLAAAAPTAGFLTRLFVIQHDCGHGSFLPHARANDWLGRAISLVTLTPYSAWRRNHAIHHATSGNLDRRGIGDVPMLTVAEYRRMPRLRRFRHRIYLHPLVLFGVGPVVQFLLLYRFSTTNPQSFRRDWPSILLTDIALALEIGALDATIGLWEVASLFAPIAVLTASFGMWLFYIQHHFVGTYWRRGEDWSPREAALRGSSLYDLPRLLHWLTLNISIHHIHHLAPRIPGYRLRRCLRQNPVLWPAGRALGLWASFRLARLTLWDEQREELISIADAAR